MNLEEGPAPKGVGTGLRAGNGTGFVPYQGPINVMPRPGTAIEISTFANDIRISVTALVAKQVVSPSVVTNCVLHSIK
jgi:hypothetical protein